MTKEHISGALETLAVVADKQPDSRKQIAAIRGVSVAGVARGLQVEQFDNQDEPSDQPG
ncbi:MAG: SMC-Scp complex subunit ScpB [Acidimicrobiaceae bacterium]|nr:SMC-Scp complex subunit ScpB [Acidimicrobiaceae bacterium]